MTCPRLAHSVSWSYVAIERSSSVGCGPDPIEPVSGHDQAAARPTPAHKTQCSMIRRYVVRRNKNATDKHLKALVNRATAA
ncbi:MULTISPECIES: hypothetical protein [unclassified Streptomyces]|uniref:hypothetical protein n=1 Tax=unclassified Streptomyces TaxID=2593676 RepID=UPI0035DFBEBC